MYTISLTGRKTGGGGGGGGREVFIKRALLKKF